MKSILESFFRMKGISSSSYTQAEVFPFENYRRNENFSAWWIEKVKAAVCGVGLGGGRALGKPARPPTGSGFFRDSGSETPVC